MEHGTPLSFLLNSCLVPTGYSACECRAGNDTCITPYGEHINKVCSGHGVCDCGQCKCEETEEGQYSGEFCEECPVIIVVLMLFKL